MDLGMAEEKILSDIERTEFSWGQSSIKRDGNWDVSVPSMAAAELQIFELLTQVGAPQSFLRRLASRIGMSLGMADEKIQGQLERNNYSWMGEISGVSVGE
jgi:hypothetical protein